MGKCDLKNISFGKKDITYKKDMLSDLPGTSLINSVDVEDEVVEDIFKFLKEKSSLLVRSDKKRLEGFEKYFFTYDYKNPINLLKLFFFRKFDWAICFEEQRGITLAALLAKKVILLTKDGNVKTKRLSKIEFAAMIFRSIVKAVNLYIKYFHLK